MVDNNNIIIDKVFKGTNAYQLGAPNPTQVGIAKSMRWINDPMNSEWRMKTFIPQLFALIGTQIVHSKEWTNPLAQFKRANISNMKAIEEIMARLIKGRTYMQEMQGNLLEYNPPEVETAIHTVNRKVQYPITYNPQELENAFLSEQGLSNFFSAVMQVPINSDNRDEYEMMKDLIAKYQDKWGFYMVSVSEHSPEEATKDDIMTLLENIRAYADKLKFYTGLYNAYKMEVFTPKDQLLVMMTPEVKAKMDVQALAAAFNVAFAEIESRIILVDEMPIPDCYALLMDENWFVCGDALLQTTNFFNGATLNTNYWLHHWEVLSMSPMMNAIAFMKNSATQVETVTVTPRFFSLEHKISSTPFRQDGTTDDLLVDKLDFKSEARDDDDPRLNSVTDYFNNSYISGNDQVMPQRYHNVNGLLVFDANPNNPDLPIEEFNGFYVFKPATFKSSATKVKNTVTLSLTGGKYAYERIDDDYDKDIIGPEVIITSAEKPLSTLDDSEKNNFYSSVDELKRIASKSFYTFDQIVDYIHWATRGQAYKSNTSFNQWANVIETWYIKYNSSTGTVTVESSNKDNNNPDKTVYPYDATTHTLGSATTQGILSLQIPDGEAFEAIMATGDPDNNGIMVKVFNVQKVLTSEAKGYTCTESDAEGIDLPVLVDDFGRVFVEDYSDELTADDLVYITITGKSTYKTDGFATDVDLEAKLNPIRYINEDNRFINAFMEAISPIVKFRE